MTVRMVQLCSLHILYPMFTFGTTKLAVKRKKDVNNSTDE